MNEDFLHYIWQFVNFNTSDLKLGNGESLQIIHVGHHNLDAGPDFSQSRIKIDRMEWMGFVEIHLKSSMWNQHKHQHDPVYNGVILHVVYEHDEEICRADGSSIPTLILKDRIDPELISSYDQFSNSPEEIICKPHWKSVNVVTKVNTIEKALVNRLERKSERVMELYEKYRGDWNEIAFKLMAENFGFKINKEPFQLLVDSVSLPILSKVNNLSKVEAIFFGQAGFLAGRSPDKYHFMLKNEYHFLRNKYNLESKVLKQSLWRFGRLRPPNFPTLRIAQLASVIHHEKHIFDLLTGSGSLQKIRQQLKPPVSEYWQNHYRFGSETSRKKSEIGGSSIDTLIVNTTIPLLVAYSKVHNRDEYMERAISYLQLIKPESNRVVKKWQEAGYVCESSADSQGVLELFQTQCLQKRCLWCNIGTSILNRTAANG